MLDTLLLQVFIALVYAAAVQEDALAAMAAQQSLHIMPEKQAKPWLEQPLQPSGVLTERLTPSP